ncbi:transcriptional regulator with XRE-family HTH domain [Rhizobium mesoamericanum]|uniref:helix-turn-helix domain-containing protein n=1 Tax=Rhizobium mesoamericanum TaxID=1079800 RepID=UPI0027887E8D|nr:transcriptional regulator with XRE-family HTH domain [Rhizobium mesoamericanum]
MFALHIVLITLHNVRGQRRVSEEQSVPMETLAKRLQERARQLGISNAEAARRAGLEERRYAHYVSGRREPDLITLVRIASALGTSPNWMLGVSTITGDPDVADFIERFANAANGMTKQEIELCVIQAEAIVAAKARR